MRGAKPQPWLNDIKFRLRFERGVRQEFPEIRTRQTGRTLKDEAIYRLTVPVPGYEPRAIEIRIGNSYVPHPKVYADGPEESPHRFSDGSLCIWEPNDPPNKRWVPRDGLLTLLRHIQIHLFKEAWWRETREWLGEEAGHGPPSGKRG